ncbi:MAG: ABC transporter ATP-binding protein [Cyclobacteriaceae bacterium]|nr:ABC transporter ATP-binding protein [Cyclobacteriaceae bacterium]
MIEIRDVCKRFGNLEVLRMISASFTDGNSYAIVGPNGSGKTTLIKSILGMVLPDKGSIEVSGQVIKGQWAYREQIGYMPQIGRYPDNMRIGHVLDMIRDLRHTRSETDEELVADLGLKALFDKRMHTLSGGTRQKVSAAIAFLFDPKIMILDEPTAGLDPLAAEVLKAKILKEKSRGKIFLITSHMMSDLDELTSEIVYLQEGAVRYAASIPAIKVEAGREKLGQAIAEMMRRDFKRPSP